jgi:hypothetical protein
MLSQLKTKTKEKEQGQKKAKINTKRTKIRKTRHTKERTPKFNGDERARFGQPTRLLSLTSCRNATKVWSSTSAKD